MDETAVYQQIESVGVVAVLRGYFPPAVALRAANALVQGGITNLEFTMNSDQALEAMQAVKEHYGDKVVAGAGTVLDRKMANAALKAGAQFIIAPNFNPQLVEFVQERKVLMIPGVFTPSEAVAAWKSGVRLLKLFPVGPMGVDYFKTIKGPLGHIRFMCNGGIDNLNARDFMQAGALAIGVAGYLVGNGRDLNAENIFDRAQLLTDQVRMARTGQGPIHRI